MEIDWDCYRTGCAELRSSVLDRFGSMLLKGAGIATVQSAPVYTGQLTAALVTILRQMTDTLKTYSLSVDDSAEADIFKMKTALRGRFGQDMNRHYFSRLSGIEELAIAQEYMSVSDAPQRGNDCMAAVFQGRSSVVQELVRKSMKRRTHLSVKMCRRL